MPTGANWEDAGRTGNIWDVSPSGMEIGEVKIQLDFKERLKNNLWRIGDRKSIFSRRNSHCEGSEAARQGGYVECEMLWKDLRQRQARQCSWVLGRSVDLMQQGLSAKANA